MVKISFPLYLITHKNSVDVSALNLARFTAGAKWLVSGRFGGKCVEISTSLEAAHGFIGWTQKKPTEWTALELNQEEMLLALRELATLGVQYAAFDSGTPHEASGRIEELLEKFAADRGSKEASDFPRTEMGDN